MDSSAGLYMRHLEETLLSFLSPLLLSDVVETSYTKLCLLTT